MKFFSILNYGFKDSFQSLQYSFFRYFIKFCILILEDENSRIQEIHMYPRMY